MLTHFYPRDAAEIAKLQREKVSLMAELSSQFTPQDQQKLTYTPPAPHAAAAHKAKKAVQRSKMDVKTLAAEKVALMKQLEGYKSESMSDPVVGGILAQFATDKGIGPLGEVKDTKEDMMGSLSAARESRKQRLHLLKMMAESMGDVSPKEALAQRVISIGLAPSTPFPSPFPSPSDQVRAGQVALCQGEAAAHREGGGRTPGLDPARLIAQCRSSLDAHRVSGEGGGEGKKGRGYREGAQGCQEEPRGGDGQGGRDAEQGARGSG